MHTISHKNSLIRLSFIYSSQNLITISKKLIHKSTKSAKSIPNMHNWHNESLS